MGLLEFSKLPVNTLVGADWNTFKEMTRNQQIAKDKRTKFYLTKAVCRLLSTLTPIQERRYQKHLADKPLAHDPFFILGHWRSGTTFVHNIFAQDRNFCYTTTYQTVFPHLMLFGQPFFKKTMGWLMPDHRPTDNMELAPDLPQEEEFALSNMMPYTFYDFWFFPQRWQEYADRFLTFEKITPKEETAFFNCFERLMRISRQCTTGGHTYLSKNPPHTGRVKAIVKHYPNAKFLYLVRNPYTVFESTRSFFRNTITPLELQHISDEEMEQNMLLTYVKLYNAFKEQKKFIPKGNLIEVKFEDFEADAYGTARRAYETLGLPDFDKAESAIRAYTDKKKGYKKNKYDYKPRTIQLVNEHWGDAIRDYGYERR